VTSAQTELHDRVATYLRESFGELLSHAPSEPAFFVALGRVGVRVEIEAVGADAAIVECYSWIAQSAVVDEHLAAFLSRRNASMRFASLCVDGEGAVIIRHALFAEATSKELLARLVGALAMAADELDLEILGGLPAA
jgi:Putative bacterial sensory transduction regulator